MSMNSTGPTLVSLPVSGSVSAVVELIDMPLVIVADTVVMFVAASVSPMSALLSTGHPGSTVSAPNVASARQERRRRSDAKAWIMFALYQRRRRSETPGGARYSVFARPQKRPRNAMPLLLRPNIGDSTSSCRNRAAVDGGALPFLRF